MSDRFTVYSERQSAEREAAKAVEDGRRLPRPSVAQRAALVAGSLVFCFLVSEVLFRTVIPAPEQPWQLRDEAEGIVRLDPNGRRDGVYTFGRLGQFRGRWHVNDKGWNSSVEYDESRRSDTVRIAVIGDSYVEAFQVDVDMAFPALLRKRLGEGYEVYSFGISGAPLSQYRQMARYARKHFAPDVILINLVHNDFHESVRDIYAPPGNQFNQVRAEDGGFVEVPGDLTPRPAWRKLLRQAAFASATIRYAFLNLNVARMLSGSVFRAGGGSAGGARFAANVDVLSVEKNRLLITIATRHLMASIRKEAGAARVVFVMDAVREDIYSGGRVAGVEWMNGMAESAAKDAGCEFLDLTSAFREAWARDGKRFEFPVDGHWNGYAHSVTARALENVLRTR